MTQYEKDVERAIAAIERGYIEEPVDQAAIEANATASGIYDWNGTISTASVIHADVYNG